MKKVSILGIIVLWFVLIGAIGANVWGYYDTRHQLECFQHADLDCNRKTDMRDLSILLSRFTSKNQKTETDVTPAAKSAAPAKPAVPLEFKTGPIHLPPTVPIYINASMVEQSY